MCFTTLTAFSWSAHLFSSSFWSAFYSVLCLLSRISNAFNHEFEFLSAKKTGMFRNKRVDMLQRSIKSDMLQRSIKSVWQVTRDMLQRSIKSDMLQRSIKSVWHVTAYLLPPPPPPPHPVPQKNHTILRAQVLTNEQNV